MSNQNYIMKKPEGGQSKNYQQQYLEQYQTASGASMHQIFTTTSGGLAGGLHHMHKASGGGGYQGSGGSHNHISLQNQLQLHLQNSHPQVASANHPNQVKSNHGHQLAVQDVSVESPNSFYYANNGGLPIDPRQGGGEQSGLDEVGSPGGMSEIRGVPINSISHNGASGTHDSQNRSDLKKLKASKVVYQGQDKKTGNAPIDQHMMNNASVTPGPKKNAFIKPPLNHIELVTSQSQAQMAIAYNPAIKPQNHSQTRQPNQLQLNHYLSAEDDGGFNQIDEEDERVVRVSN